MNRFEFGVLVYSLREDIRRTQADLAERSGIDVSVISCIERGVRKGLLKDNVLMKLAQGLQLTSLERREFLFAASGVADQETPRKDDDGGRKMKKFDANAFLLDLGEQISRIALPVFVTDSFCDVILANRCAIEFYYIPHSMLLNAKDMIGGHNQARYIFHPDSKFQELFRDDWENQAIIHLRYFRRRTLRFRATQYYSKLMKELLDNKKYPLFEKYWQKMLFEPHDDYFHPIQKPNSKDAHAFIEVDSLLALTQYGELYLHQASPLNKKTAKRIETIYNKVGEGYAQFTSFPDKRKF